MAIRLRSENPIEKGIINNNYLSYSNAKPQEVKDYSNSNLFASNTVGVTPVNTAASSSVGSSFSSVA